MRLRELIEKQEYGTFIGVRLTQESNQRLTEWMQENSIEKPETPDQLHVTLILDKTRSLSYNPIRYDPPVVVDSVSYKIESFGEEGDYTVLTFDSPALQHRHKKLKSRFDIQWDWPDYTPHITLTSHPQEINLTPPDFDLELDREYMEAFSNE